MTAGAVAQPSRHELAVFVLLAFASSWVMHIPLALATLRSGDPTASTGSPLNLLAPWGPAVAAIIAAATRSSRSPPTRTYLPYLAVFLIGAFIYTLGEELGWRACALPRLQQHRSALIADLHLRGAAHGDRRAGRGGCGGRGGLGRRADSSFPVAATTTPQRHAGPTTHPRAASRR